MKTKAESREVSLCRHLLDREYRPIQAAVLAEAYFAYGITDAQSRGAQMTPPIEAGALLSDIAEWQRLTPELC